MSRNNRIAYLITTLCVLASAFFIYGAVGCIGPLIFENKWASFCYFGLLGGIGFSMLLSDVILAVTFFKKRSLSFKIVAAILWPIIAACIFYAGVALYIPYQIYNIVKIVKEKNPPELPKQKEAV